MKKVRGHDFSERIEKKKKAIEVEPLSIAFVVFLFFSFSTVWVLVDESFKRKQLTVVIYFFFLTLP